MQNTRCFILPPWWSWAGLCRPHSLEYCRTPAQPNISARLPLPSWAGWKCSLRGFPASLQHFLGRRRLSTAYSKAWLGTLLRGTVCQGNSLWNSVPAASQTPSLLLPAAATNGFKVSENDFIPVFQQRGVPGAGFPWRREWEFCSPLQLWRTKLRHLGFYTFPQGWGQSAGTPPWAASV